jgi:SnoaL-like domain
MSAEVIEVAKRFMAAARTDNSEALRELCHPDFEAREPNALPYGGTYLGLEAYMELRRLTKAFCKRDQSLHLEDLEFIGDDEAGVVVGRTMFTGTLAANQARVSTPVLIFLRVSGATVRSLEMFLWDTAELMRLATGPQTVAN